MKQWTIFDSQRTPVPGFDVSWLPSQAGAYVSLHINRGQAGTEAIDLEAGPYVGVLPLTSGEILQIAPRIGRQSLTRMLLITARLESAVRREFEEFARLGHDGSESIPWIDLLARVFLQHLRFIEKSSLRVNREAVYQRRQSARGRVLMAQTYHSLVRNEPAPFHTMYRERTYDTPEHRVLGAAAALVLRLHASEDPDEVALRWMRRFHLPRSLGDDLRIVTTALSAGRYTGPRAYYIRVLVMAQLILAQGGLVFTDTAAVESEALLTNVYILFERYIRVIIRNALSPAGYVVEKKETSVPSLFADGGAELKPDVIISDASGVRLLIDVKYKLHESIVTADYYQMAAYLRGYKAEHGIIVRPALSVTTESIVTRRMNHGGMISELRIGMQDPVAAESALVTNIKAVLAGRPVVHSASQTKGQAFGEQS